MSLLLKTQFLKTILTRKNPDYLKVFFTGLSNKKDSSEKQVKPTKMENFKNNPYFSKYEAKLKAVYR